MVFTFLPPGGVGSNILACMSVGRLEYTGRITSSLILVPNFLVLSFNISNSFSLMVLHFILIPYISEFFTLLSIFFYSFRDFFNLICTNYLSSIKILHHKNELVFMLHIVNKPKNTGLYKIKIFNKPFFLSFYTDRGKQKEITKC